ncbi:MAG: glycoside hydrolase family 88 protein [Phycisphaerae bacterium]|nr:glycoside hydrolase family 88 protein [Phycisphaerae bacterium]
MKCRYLLKVIGLCVAFVCVTGCESTPTGVQAESVQDLPWSVKMTETIMQRNPDIWSVDFGTRPKWTYTYGLVFKGMWQVWEKTGDPDILAYVQTYYDAMINDQGEIQTYKMSDYNIDMINAGKVLFALYDTTRKEKYRIALATLREQMQAHPRTSEGGFWHKNRYPHQMWLDGLYMGSPFLAQYAVTYDEPALFDEVANQLLLVERHTRDDRTGLLYHAWDESREQRWSDPDTGQSPHFWGRAMGWYAMALVDCLDYLPRTHAKRGEIVAKMERFFGAVARFQDQDTGLWYQVVDQGSREGNYLEATCSCMFAYAMAKAARLGYVDQSFHEVAEKAYQGILRTLITVDSENLVTINQCCSVAGLGGDPYRDGSYDYYVNEPIRSNDAKALGPFILASLEFEK